MNLLKMFEELLERFALGALIESIVNESEDIQNYLAGITTPTLIAEVVRRIKSEENSQSSSIVVGSDPESGLEITPILDGCTPGEMDVQLSPIEPEEQNQKLEDTDHITLANPIDESLGVPADELNIPSSPTEELAPPLRIL